MVQCDRRNRAVLRQGNCGLGGDLGLGGGGVDYKPKRFASAFAQIHRGPDSAQIMRAGTGGDDDQFRHADHRLARHSDRSRGVDHRQCKP